MNQRLVLKPGKERSVLQRHPWIFSGAIAQGPSAAQPGAIVEVVNHRHEFLARGYYNPHSQIAVRLLSWDPLEEIDRTYFERRLRAAFARRAALDLAPQPAAYRLVSAEADDLPGLIVDRYGEWLVLQALTLGIEPWRGMLVDLLVELTNPRGIYERSDMDVRSQEGLPALTGPLWGAQPPERVLIAEHGHSFWVDIRHGHKTGFYLDQRENRRKVALLCAGRDVLNAFSYTGGFAVYAAACGARSVTNLDSSAGALAVARENMQLNNLVRTDDAYIEGDAFQVLRRLRDRAQQYDMVVLDPPKFAFSRAQLQSAARGYKDINMLGMRLLRPGGILCTFSCSGLVSEDLFQKILFGASLDVCREVRILERLSQASDHPVLLTFPESAYLKGFVCHVE